MVSLKFIDNFLTALVQNNLVNHSSTGNSNIKINTYASKTYLSLYNILHYDESQETKKDY